MNIKVEIGIDDRNQLVVIEFAQPQPVYGSYRVIDVILTGVYDKEELSALISQLEQAYGQLQ